MGMDVYGRNPSTEAGKYFRASVWSWRPIHDIICELCSDLFDQEMLDSLGYNDGNGPETQEICTEMAVRFENWMEHNAEGRIIEQNAIRTDEHGRCLSQEDVEKNEKPSFSPYRVEDDHLKEWIEFMRHCGGFQVH